MSIRRPLQDQLLSAWRLAIQRDYQNQRVNSERSLQASFWSQLNLVLPPKTRRMFIEPRLSCTVRGRRRNLYPDLVICNSKQVISVVELKYLPRGRPRYDKDLESLRTIARCRGKLTVANDRFRGTTRDSRVYPFADSVWFVWAGVHRPGFRSYDSSDVPLLSDGMDELEGCFMQLHAETDPREPPHVFARTR